MYHLATKHSDRLKNDKHQWQTSGIKSRLQYETVNN